LTSTDDETYWEEYRWWWQRDWQSSSLDYQDLDPLEWREVKTNGSTPHPFSLCELPLSNQRVYDRQVGDV
jgi:hypothetical protein